jgi:hypothetical protein
MDEIELRIQVLGLEEYAFEPLNPPEPLKQRIIVVSEAKKNPLDLLLLERKGYQVIEWIAPYEESELNLPRIRYYPQGMLLLENIVSSGGDLAPGIAEYREEVELLPIGE